MAKKRTPVSKEGQKRISKKIEHLVNTGEVPNTPQGRKQAAAISYSLERKGGLGKRGGLRKKK